METIALLNGVMMTTSSWVFQTRVLSNHRLVLHDFRGQLENLMPGPFTLEQHVEDLRELLDREGIDRAHLVGTSYGGEVGMLFALTYPERVQSLCVIASCSEVGPELRKAIEEWRDVARNEPDRLYDVTAPCNFSRGFLTESFMEAGRMRLRSYPPEFFPAFADLCDAFLALDITDRLHEIKAPTLVIAAERDRLKPVHYSRIIAARIPNAELVVVPDAPHAVFLERARDVNELLLSWVARHSAGRR